MLAKAELSYDDIDFEVDDIREILCYILRQLGRKKGLG